MYYYSVQETSANLPIIINKLISCFHSIILNLLVENLWDNQYRNNKMYRRAIQDVIGTG